MTAPLSPTQKIVAAFNERHELCGPFDDDWVEQCLAAALRAAAREIEPTMEERKTDPNRRGPGFFNGISCGCAQLLFLATELEVQ
jgi:hypothetical protein